MKRLKEAGHVRHSNKSRCLKAVGYFVVMFSTMIVGTEKSLAQTEYAAGWVTTQTPGQVAQIAARWDSIWQTGRIIVGPQRVQLIPQSLRPAVQQVANYYWAQYFHMTGSATQASAMAAESQVASTVGLGGLVMAEGAFAMCTVGGSAIASLGILMIAEDMDETIAEWETIMNSGSSCPMSSSELAELGWFAMLLEACDALYNLAVNGVAIPAEQEAVILEHNLDVNICAEIELEWAEFQNGN